MITSDEKFYAQRDTNFKQRVCNILFDDSIEHSENEALELITNLKLKEMRYLEWLQQQSGGSLNVN